MLRLVLIGCGSHSELAHASPLAHYVQQNPNEVVLAGACDKNLERAKRFCREYGFERAYSDWEEMLEAEEPDGVISVLPIEHILEVGTGLLRTGIPVSLEKPPGNSYAEAAELAEMARVTGTNHRVSLNRRFSPTVNCAVHWSKEQGTFRYIRGQMYRNARREEEFLWGTGIHVVDAMRHIGGEVTDFRVEKLGGAEDSTAWYLITLEYESGCVGHIEILPSCGKVEEHFEIFGDDFRAIATTMGGFGESVRCWKMGKLEVEEIASPSDPLFLKDGSYEETATFITSVRDDVILHPTLEEVLPSLRICDLKGSEGV